MQRTDHIQLPYTAKFNTFWKLFENQRCFEAAKIDGFCRGEMRRPARS